MVERLVMRVTAVRPDLSGALFIGLAERSGSQSYKKAGTEGG